MKHRIEELLRIKGLRWADLSRLTKINQSNLMSSLEGNPKYSRLKEIANALGVTVADILPDAKPSTAAGMLTIDKKTYALVPVEAPARPHFQYDKNRLHERVEQFLLACLRYPKQRPLAICGVLDEKYPVSMFYDPINGTLYLAIERGKEDVLTWQYEHSSHGAFEGYKPTKEDIEAEAKRMAVCVMDDIDNALQEPYNGKED